MILLEDVGQLVLWLTLLVMSLNLVFLFFLIYRRIARRLYFNRKDAARARYSATVAAFLKAVLPPEEAAASLRDPNRAAEREVRYRMPFTAWSPEHRARA